MVYAHGCQNSESAVSAHHPSELVMLMRGSEQFVQGVPIAGAQLYSEHRLKFLNDSETWPVCQECDNGNSSEILRDLDEAVVEISEGRNDEPTRIKGSQAEVDMQQQLGH